MKLKTPKFPSKGHHDMAQSASPFPPAAPAPTGPPVAPAQTAPTHVAPAQAPHGVGAPAHVGVPQAAPVAEPVSPLKKAASGLAAPTRQRNAAVMIAGAAFIIVAAALAASVASSFDDSIEVLVASADIAEGQPIAATDFRTVKIAAGEGDIQAVSPTSIDDLVGRVAAGPIGEGSMIHPAQFAIAAEEDLVVVGAALGPDQYPATGLKPGDQVRLIEVTSRFGADQEGFTSGREITVGEITDVVRLRTGDALHFSIRVGESAASVVAQRISEDRLTIALVDESLTLNRIDPLEPIQPVVPIELEEDESGE